MAIQAKPGELLRIQHQRVVDETIIVGKTQHVNWMSDSEFVSCTFDIAEPNVIRFSRSRLIHCVFRPRKEVNISVGDNYWEGCTFHGRYTSTHFGSSSDDVDGPSEWPDMALRGCDFSATTMHGCCFQRTDLASTKFPPWPCFTVLHPHKNQRNTFIAAGLPSSYIASYSVGDAGLSAVVYHWPSLVKRLTPPLDPEVVRGALQKLDFVRL